MSNKHFSYFRVKNFKRFKDLEVKDIGQFNLVLGDNNVGKTSLLEALLWKPSEFIIPSTGQVGLFGDANQYRYSFFVEFLIKAFSYRNYGDIANSFWKYSLNINDRQNTDILFSKQKGEFLESFRSVGNQTIKFFLNGDEILDFIIRAETPNSRKEPSYPFKKEIYVDDTIENVAIPFLPFQKSYDDEIAEFYLEEIQGDRLLKKHFVDNLRSLFPEIDDLEPSLVGTRKSLLINRSTSNFSVPLGFFGEGTIKVAKILSYLLKFKGEKLMLDEIDTGIHYSRMKDYWKVILQSAKENDVQVFATTHNRECMENFKVALEELGAEYMDKARTITLKQSPKTGDIIAYSNSFSVLQSAVELGNDLR